MKLANLSKNFKDAERELCVINGLNVELPLGKSIAIVGSSGIGKSTLLYLLGGLDRPSSGSIFFEGSEINRFDPDELARFRRENVGFIFQFHHLLGEFTALENISMPLVLSGLNEAEAASRAEETLAKVGLRDRSNHIPAKLSGGESQRVAVARAVVNRPRLLLADEPTGNLDPANALIVQDLLMQLHRELKNTLIIVTHSRELASAMDLVLEMSAGGALRQLR